MTPSRTLYPSDGSDDEWAFVAPYLTLLPEDAGQRTYDLREVFNGLRWIMRTGAPWRMMPHNLPPWWADRLITLWFIQLFGEGCVAIKTFVLFIHEQIFIKKGLCRQHRFFLR
jgi:transposase